MYVPLLLLPVPDRGEKASEEAREGRVRHGPAEAVSEVEMCEFLDGFAEKVGGEKEGEEEEEERKDDLSQGPPKL